MHQVGFANPKVIAAVKAQLDTLPFSTRRFTNQVAVRYAEKLAGALPDGLDRILLCPGGTAAIGMALKLARLATGRNNFV